MARNSQSVLLMFNTWSLTQWEEEFFNTAGVLHLTWIFGLSVVSDECWMKGLSASNWGCDYHLNTLDRFPCFPNHCYCFITVLTRSSLIRVTWRPDRAGHPSHDAALVRAERDSGSVSVPVRCDRNGALCLRSRSRPYYEHTPWYHGTRHKLSPCSRAALDSSCIVFKSTHTHTPLVFPVFPGVSSTSALRKGVCVLCEQLTCWCVFNSLWAAVCMWCVFMRSCEID